MTSFFQPSFDKKFVVFFKIQKMDLHSDKAAKKEYVDHAIKLPEARALSGPHVSLSQMKQQLVEVKSIIFKTTRSKSIQRHIFLVQIGKIGDKL